MQGTFTAVYEKRGRWYIAYIEEIPGVNTQARTLNEARANLREAFELIVAANREVSANQQQGAEVLRETLVVEMAR